MKNIILLLILICSSISCVSSERTHHRVKRKVLFTKNSKLFFRINGKDNVIPWTQIFAHGWGFRINWELPETLPKRHKFFKRDVHNEFDDLNMIEGYSCILKYLCEFVSRIKSSTRCGVFCEIGNIVSRSQGMDVDFFQGIFERCVNYIEDCPYSFRDTFYFLNSI